MAVQRSLADLPAWARYSVGRSARTFSCIVSVQHLFCLEWSHRLFLFLKVGISASTYVILLSRCLK
jgi:hypothetical protein